MVSVIFKSIIQTPVENESKQAVTTIQLSCGNGLH